MLDRIVRIWRFVPMIVESMMPRTRIAVLACLLVASMGQASAAEPADPPTELAVSQGRCVDVVVADKPAACVEAARNHPGALSERAVRCHDRAHRPRGDRLRGRTRSVAPGRRRRCWISPGCGLARMARARTARARTARRLPCPSPAHAGSNGQPDGTAWTDVACDARDDQGKTYRLLFQPSGKLEVERS